MMEIGKILKSEALRGGEGRGGRERNPLTTSLIAQ